MITDQIMIKNDPSTQQLNLLAISAKVLYHQPLAVLAEDCNRKVKIVNKAFCKLFQIPLEPEELIGIDCRKLTMQAKELLKDGNGFSNQIDEILKNHVPVSNLEFELKDGSCLNVEYTPCVESDNLLGHIWCYTDVSAKADSAKQINDQKLFFENILNSIPADIAIFDKEHKYIFLNNVAISDPVLRAKMIGKDDFDYCRFKNRDVSFARFRREKFTSAIEEKKEIEWEDEITGVNGEKEYLLRRLHPNFDETGNISFITAYGVNISHLKKKEHELMLSEYKQRKMLNQLNEVVFTLTYSKKIELLNPAWTKILGYATADCINKPLLQFVIPPDLKIMSDAIDNVISGKTETVNKIVGFVAKDGKTKWINVYMVKTQKFIHLALWGTLTDVTEQQIAGQELLKTLQKEKELNELKSSFVNMVSHEFRTPLAGILSSVELLELIDEQFYGPVKSKSVFYYERIKSQIARMTELMNNVLLLGKIEAGKVEFKPAEVKLSNLCKEIIHHNFYSPTNHRKINITIQGKEKVMQLDSSLMKHILINLLTNALKYSPQNTDPELKLIFGRTYTTIRVIDNGIGIPANELKKLFSSFFRASNTGNIEGTGLGLVVVKYFVELHGGSIEVQSRRGKGSVFTVTIPNLITY